VTQASSYLDSSFLAKAYLVEFGSDEVAHFLRVRRPRPLISPLTDVELTSAFARELAGDELMRALSRYNEDKQRGVVQQMPMPTEVYSAAQQLVVRFGRESRLRTLDALQLATARHYGVDIFATYDGALATLAYKLGLYVVGARP
jgi:predicted nucleic acid-binding protein